jgi:hypothetical protein
LGRADVARSDNRPFRIVPSRGKVPENAEHRSVTQQRWYVLQQEVSRSNHANESEPYGPKMPLVVGSGE